ncbi:MAG TPA: hypothetical protein VHP83_23935 [Aggregatilineaceae bacterium]|nr:hypothetical protein [Aggregatilineaceae bacterium]
MLFSFFRSQSGSQVDDFLMAHADALVRGVEEVQTLKDRTDPAFLHQVDDLLKLAEMISLALPGVIPSEQFVNELRQQLIMAGTLDDVTLWAWIRGLPPRTQLAASIGGATLTAGVVWFARRPVRNAIEGWWHRWTATA